MNNLLTSLPNHIDHEQVEELLSQPNVKIERILSKGQTSPETGWYDQDENEWVVVLQGSGEITFEDGDKVQLEPGDLRTCSRGHVLRTLFPGVRRMPSCSSQHTSV